MPHPVRVFCAVARKLTDHRPPTLPSLGDALAVQAAPASRAPEVASAALAAAPWCAVVLLAEQPLSSTEAGALLPVLPDTTTILQGGLDVDPAQILAALRLRKPPTAADMGDYLRLRGLSRDLVAAVEDALAPQPASAHRSILNRRLGEFGPLRARSWRALLRVLQFTTHVTGSVEQAAGEDGCDSRTFRARSQDLVGLSPRRTLETPGWEWKLEAALRRHGYIPWPTSTRRRSAAFTAPVFLEIAGPA